GFRVRAIHGPMEPAPRAGVRRLRRSEGRRARTRRRHRHRRSRRDAGGDAGMESLRFFWDEVVALDPAAAAKDERHMKLTREGQLGDLWRKAGLIDVREKALVIEQAFTSFSDYWA